MKLQLLTIALLASYLAVPPSVMAEDTTVTASEKQFMLDTAQAGLTEVRLGDVAGSKSANSEIKDFAKQMIADHTKANNALREVAKKKGVTLPDSLDAQHQAVVDSLNAKKGDDFDTAYTRTMVRDHRKVRDSLSSHRNTGDADLRDWVSNTLPTIRHHFQMATKLNDKQTR